MLSPVSHARTRAEADVYRAEPYVVAADVYGVAPHIGRGGWTWYTGSAGWMQRVALERVLGITLHGGTRLRIAPCIPDTWPGFRATLRLMDRVTVRVEVTCDGGAARVVACDGGRVEDGAAWVELPASGEATVRVTMGV